jgi:hypothetical protein
MHPLTRRVTAPKEVLYLRVGMASIANRDMAAKHLNPPFKQLQVAQVQGWVQTSSYVCGMLTILDQPRQGADPEAWHLCLVLRDLRGWRWRRGIKVALTRDPFIGRVVRNRVSVSS